MAPQPRKHATPQPSRYTKHLTFTIRAGSDSGKQIREGEWFRFFGGEEFFKFKAHQISLKSGSESIEAWGGMPARGQGRDGNSHGYAWRSFPINAEILLCKPPK